jgi:hypothetical protein
MSRLARDQLNQVASQVLGAEVEVVDWHVSEVSYESGSPATGSLRRLSGTTAAGHSFTVFLKTVQHVRHWPSLHMIPPSMRDDFAEGFPWSEELTMWQPGFADRLPAGLRVPVLYLAEDLGDDRVRIWMEDVQATAGDWDLAQYRRAAGILGGLAALRSDPALFTGCRYPVGYGLRKYVDGRVRNWSVPMLLDENTWAHPLIAGTVDPQLRNDLVALLDDIEPILDNLDALPQALPHGDASPQNLLIPLTEPQTLVAIDISFQNPAAIGFDLGQLLVGLVHAGGLSAAALAQTHEVLVPAFMDTFQHYGGVGSADDVMRGYVGGLVARAAFTSLPFEQLGAEPSPELSRLFAERTALTRFIVELAHEHL